MVHATSSLLLLLLSLALLAPRHSAKKCSLTGNWTNDLGSNMTIKAVNDKGEFRGTYYTAVADTPNKITKSPLLGIQNITVCQPTFGFTVGWTFIETTTVFTGQCFINENGEEILKTIWLLRSNVTNIGDDWKATRVGNNNFTRLHTENMDGPTSPTSATMLEC
ncbi:avidin-related protein 4/5-like [Lagopus leucura]|uniref:avidin-related protein 4/5-like n=1 Tax=Lagopus leucura TaxID=30410 RepID=UPI001C6640F1|nr:avidin-related protein 4/5-like [Lagopus leucura]